MTPQPVEKPIIIVHEVDGGKQQYLILPTILDPLLSKPTMFGIVLSDLLDHIAAAYAHIANADERALRDKIMRVMRDENRFKDEDPKRASGRSNKTLERAN
jgi:hypothetical protein